MASMMSDYIKLAAARVQSSVKLTQSKSPFLIILLHETHTVLETVLYAHSPCLSIFE